MTMSRKFLGFLTVEACYLAVMIAIMTRIPNNELITLFTAYGTMAGGALIAYMASNNIAEKLQAPASAEPESSQKAPGAI